jgi:hypothetical protein
LVDNLRTTSSLPLVAGGVILLLALGAPHGEEARPAPRPSATRSTPEECSTFRWEEVRTAARRIALADGDRFAGSCASKSAATVYLEGLVLMSRGAFEKALDCFQAVALESIPDAYLYAPFRLHGALRPRVENPYRARLRVAADLGTLSPLVEARFEAREGRLRQALHAYMRTDPGRWVWRDVEALRTITFHGGLTREARLVLGAALRAGRLSERLQPIVRRLAALSSPAAIGQVGRASLARVLKDGTGARAAVVTGLRRLEANRRLFLQGNYTRLLAEAHPGGPLTATDETVVLLTLAAARTNDRAALERWSQELRRRRPERRVERWLQRIRADGQ